MLVWNNPEVLQTLHHGQTWATDETINKALLKKYANYDYLYECIEHNIILFESKILDIRDRMNEFEKTLHYEYNPIENYRMTEEEETDGDSTRTDNLKSESTTTTSGYGLNDGVNDAPVGKGTGETENTGTQGVKSKGKRKLKRAGNIGVTTSQQMIEAQRKLLVSMMEVYTREFADCFNLTNTVTHGNPWERY